MKKILLLSIGMFALGLDAYVIAGLVPTIGISFHASSAEIGQTVTIFTLCYALSAPICSTLLTGRSTREILLIAMAIFTLANAASALTGSLVTLYIARAIAGIGAGLYSPMAAAAAVSLVPAKQKGRAIGFILGGMSTGTVIGVPLGLMVAQYSNWANTFWLVTVIGVLALIGIYLKFPSFPARTPPSIKERLSMLSDRRIAWTVVVSLLTSISSLGLYTYIAPVVQSSIGSNVSLSPYLWVWGLGGIIGSFTIGLLIDYTGKPRQLLIIILAIMAVSFILLPWIISYSILGFLPFILWGIMGWSSQAPQQHALLSLQPEHAAVAVALNSSANYLGSAIGSGLGGLAIWWGVMPANLPILASIVAMIACCTQWYIINKTNPLQAALNQ